MKLRLASPALILAGLAAGLSPTLAPGGPVPGVETFTRRAVDFPVSPSTEVWDIGNDEYLVTFKWKPEEKVETPGVAGDFNNWSRTDLPFSGPDESGTYTVTARVRSGEFRYKFISGPNGWHTDPLNPVGAPDGHSGTNSILRLGVIALLSGKEAARGDGKVEMRAFRHSPEDHTFFDLYTPADATIRARTLVGDVEAVDLELVGRTGKINRVAMANLANDHLYDFWEVHYRRHEGDDLVGYRFIVRDGSLTESAPGFWPLVMDPSTIIKTPDWARHAIWYQIMVDRFRDGDPSNNPEHTTGSGRIAVTHPWKSEWYTEKPWERENGRTFWQWGMYDRLYGGDFAGVEEKLDYLKELGITAIYFNPVFESTNSHKYNAQSYMHADDGYGTPGEFAKAVAAEDPLDPSTWIMTESDKKLIELIAAAKKRGIRVIFDGVFNHVGNDATYFKDVRKNLQKSPFADWFDVRNWDPFEYTGWAGHDALPQFRKNNEEGLASASLRQHIYNVTTRWMDPNGDGDPSDGIDGWRLDVPMDVPLAFWRGWCAHVREVNPDAYIVGEIWDPAEEWLNGETFDAVMNYQFAKAAFRFFANKEKKTSATQFDRELARLRMRYPRAHTEVLQNLFDSHDTDRWVSRIVNPDHEYDGNNRIQDEGVVYDDKKPGPEAYQRQRLMALFQATYVGVPMIWYGTEVGMFGADDPRCRMPMWWEDLGAYDSPDYAVDKDQFAYFQSLFALRKRTELLNTGDFQTLLTDDAADVFVFLRWDEEAGQAVVVALNNSSNPQTITVAPPSGIALPKGFKEPKVLLALPGLDKNAPTVKAGASASVELALPPLSGVVFNVNR